MYNVSLTLSYLCWLYCIWSAYCYIFTLILGLSSITKKWHVMTFYMYMCSYLVLHKIVHYNVCTLIYFKCTCKCMHSHQTQVHCSATQVHLHNACTGALVLIQMHCIQCTKIYLLKTSTMTCSVYLLSKWIDIFQLINELQGTVWSWFLCLLTCMTFPYCTVFPSCFLYSDSFCFFSNSAALCNQ